MTYEKYIEYFQDALPPPASGINFDKTKYFFVKLRDAETIGRLAILQSIDCFGTKF